ncbi:carboxymuconolactone decarboxylase family protein [Pseudonocardia lacus]|uniref:carboxymuconolactone decarboxylase family protein n=1 Tax=Pseudonocardia lacus TaxID=2835865 RepID=UPI0027E25E72|nr:carboxymuconolactone decarboxylase family protein [Pseudonocardia lacus]
MSTSTSTSTSMSARDDVRSRLPDPGRFFPQVATLAGAMHEAVHNGSIPPTTIAIAQLRAGQLVGSTYHTVRQTGALRDAGEAEERITAVASWRDAPCFTDAERVALALVEAVLTANPHGERVPDALFAEAAAHYDEQALWTLTLVIAQICFFVPVALIAKPIPGRPLGQHYSD